jgi:hypothetical protein
VGDERYLHQFMNREDSATRQDSEIMVRNFLQIRYNYLCSSSTNRVKAGFPLAQRCIENAR